VKNSHLQQVFTADVAELTKVALEYLTALHEPDEDSDAVLKRSHLTSRDLKQGLQITENF
jgi:hypothetical protein